MFGKNFMFPCLAIIVACFISQAESHGRNCSTPAQLVALNKLAIKAQLIPNKVLSGKYFTETIIVNNTASLPITDVFVSADLPEGIEFESAGSTPKGLASFSMSNHIVSSTVFTIAGNQTVAFAFRLKADDCIVSPNITFVNDIGIINAGPTCYWHANVKQVCNVEVEWMIHMILEGKADMQLGQSLILLLCTISPPA